MHFFRSFQRRKSALNLQKIARVAAALEASLSRGVRIRKNLIKRVEMPLMCHLKSVAKSARLFSLAMVIK